MVVVPHMQTACSHFPEYLDLFVPDVSGLAADRAWCASLGASRAGCSGTEMIEFLL